jgi:endonuclease/exonuclease/phosphatase family metal-dependent hydrolase
MKVLSLNTWGGIEDEIFFNYIKEQSLTIDIFCFQEVFSAINPPIIKGEKGELHNQLQQLEQLLPDFRPYYREQIYNANLSTNTEFDLSYGLAIFVRYSIDSMVVEEGDHMIYGSKNVGHVVNAPSPRNIQYLKLNNGVHQLNIFNFHGVWIKNCGKEDQPARIEQSHNIISFVQNFEGQSIIMGDFNLLPDTRSVRMIEEQLQLRNLITDYDISSTRSSLYPMNDQFADYMFVSPDLTITAFSVPVVEASDHLPMIVDVEY